MARNSRRSSRGTRTPSFTTMPVTTCNVAFPAGTFFSEIVPHPGNRCSRRKRNGSSTTPHATSDRLKNRPIFARPQASASQSARCGKSRASASAAKLFPA